MTEISTNVTADLVLSENRLAIVDELFGAAFPMRIEPFVYQVSGHISNDYNGGYWDYFQLSNGGFLMIPPSDDYYCLCDNGFEGMVSAEVLGASACMYAYSHLSFSDDRRLSELCTKHYYLLRDYIPEMGEVDQILAMTD